MVVFRPFSAYFLSILAFLGLFSVFSGLFGPPCWLAYPEGYGAYPGWAKVHFGPFQGVRAIFWPIQRGVEPVKAAGRGILGLSRGSGVYPRWWKGLSRGSRRPILDLSRGIWGMWPVSEVWFGLVEMPLSQPNLPSWNGAWYIIGGNDKS